MEDLKDESEPYRRMVMETIDKVVRDLGTADVDARLEELLIDGILYAFQEQVCMTPLTFLMYCLTKVLEYHCCEEIALLVIATAPT